jgi:cytochrome c oxidase cbb3-type subunit 3
MNDKNEEDKLLDHNYDGIKEFDNDLPRWWVALFWGGIIFGFFYVGLFHTGIFRFDSQKLDERMARIEQVRAEIQEQVRQQGAGSPDVILALAQDPQALERGKVHYAAKCAACHLEGGQGLVGPNLTDDYWIHGGSVLDVKRVIVEGVLEKGMVAWGNLMTDDEINDVTAFVWSLHGTNPANPKAPDGEFVARN